MANKQAAYKTPLIIDAIEEWFQQADQNDTTRSLSQMHRQYINNLLATKPAAFGRLTVPYEDFARCLYKLGVVDIQLPDGTPCYRRLQDWRPSAEATMRYRPPAEPTEPTEHKWETL